MSLGTSKHVRIGAFSKEITMVVGMRVAVSTSRLIHLSVS